MRWSLVLALALSACATVPTTQGDGPLVRCVTDPDCFLVEVQNHIDTDVRIFVNQSYLGFVDATKTRTLTLRRSQLDGALCGQVRVHGVTGGDAYSAKDCGRPGGHFTIQIENDYVWFIPWVRKT